MPNESGSASGPRGVWQNPDGSVCETSGPTSTVVADSGRHPEAKLIQVIGAETLRQSGRFTVNAMNPIQSEILRTAARLSSLIYVVDSTGQKTHFVRVRIPTLFLWFEFWRLQLSGPAVMAGVYERAMKWLDDKKLLTVAPSMLFLHPGMYSYRSLEGHEWSIEAREVDESFLLVDGSTYTIAKHRTEIIASPADKMAAFQECLSRNPMRGAQNLFSADGVRVDGMNHPHFTVTDEGWNHVDLTVDDYVTQTESTVVAHKAAELMTIGEKEVWDTLAGAAFKAAALAERLHTSEQTVKEHVSHLRDKGFSVENKRGRGYFRPDAPPST